MVLSLLVLLTRFYFSKIVYQERPFLSKICQTFSNFSFWLSTFSHEDMKPLFDLKHNQLPRASYFNCIVLRLLVFSGQNVIFSLLTLPVRRYLVPTPSTRGRGRLSRPPMISKTVDSTTFKFGMPLGLSMRGRKLVELMI